MPKYNRKPLGTILLMGCTIFSGLHLSLGTGTPGHAAESGRHIALAGGDGVSVNGWLRVSGGGLVNQEGQPVQLRGMSSHGLQWFPEYTNARALQTIGAYGANLFRVAMYADSSEGGYNESADAARRNKAWMYAAVENALAADLYVIVDWHILKDKNPLHTLDAAVSFFGEISSQYSQEPGVIYEICNEPNGETTWEDVFRYAEKVIPVIRNNSPHAIVIVGTPKFSTDLRPALEKPLPFANVMYTLHAYTGHVDKNFERIVTEFLQAKMPIFITEWGINADDNRDNFAIAKRFVDFFDKHNLSWANWSLCNKKEPYSAIKPDITKLSGWTDEDLSLSGKLVFSRLFRKRRPFP